MTKDEVHCESHVTPRQGEAPIPLLLSAFSVTAAMWAYSADADGGRARPSTIISDRGRYYVFTTGKGAPTLSSPDGHKSGLAPPARPSRRN